VGIARAGRDALVVFRVLLVSQLREHPARLLVTIIAIALGVALASSVYLVNSAALNEFSLATKRLVGEADIVVRGPREGFAESQFVMLAHDPSVRLASPVLELDAALPGRRDTLKVLGVDPLRAGALQPALLGDIGAHVLDLFAPDGIFLSTPAATELHMKTGDLLAVSVGDAVKSLKVLGLLSPDTYTQPLGIMDIASAQWTFERIGRLNRIDLALVAGTDVARFKDALARRLAPGVVAVAPQVERDRAVTVTRAYRVNLNMLALVALWTGAFLVFSTQSLSVLRRRRSLGLLRAIGVTRRQLQLALVGEGAALGAVGALLGVILGALLAAAMLRLLTADPGNGPLRAAGVSLSAAPWAVAGFFLVGIAVASLGAWMPAAGAARQAPARALKGGGGEHAPVVASASLLGVGLLAAGSVLAWLPPVAGLPLFGYASVAALLFGAILLVPVLTVRLLRAAPKTGRVVFDTALAQLKDNVGLSTLSLASIIVSFSLMVAMAIMVYSFRVSFDHWLGKLLPADLQLRVPFGSDTAFWPAATQARIAALGAVDRVEFRRIRQFLLDPTREPVTLIARDLTLKRIADELPLVRSIATPLPAQSSPAWISEALQDLYHYQLGDPIDLPLAGRSLRFTVAGVWRDYARNTGTIVIERAKYIAATGDRDATEGAVWLAPGSDAAAAESAIRSLFPRADSLEVMTSTVVRERSMQIFDRAFAITYALEAIAVLIGLTGVSFAASSTALARRAEFGMLRHVGMLRGQVVALLADEGILMSILGVVYGLTLGGVLSLVLVFVINRQSFNWSIDLAVPAWQLALLSVILVAAAAITAIWSGRAAMSQDAVRAVREDW
jgi:putative ABC transport system permease protein